MKISTPILLAAVLAGGVLSSAVTSSATAAQEKQDRNKEFEQKLKPIVATKAYDDLARLLKAYQEEAITYVDDLVQRMSQGSSDEIEAEFQMLSKGWKDSFKSNFVQIVYDFHSRLALNGVQRAERRGLIEQYRKTFNRLDSALRNAYDPIQFETCANDFIALADGFEKNGDLFYAARSAASAAACYDEGYRKKDANLKKVCEWFGKAVLLFDKVDLKHSYYQQCKARHEGLIAAGHGPEAPKPETGPEAPPAGPVADPNANAVVSKTSFELIKELDQFLRPNYYCDEIYAAWTIVPLAGKGSTGSFAAMEKGPKLMRPDLAKIGVDQNGDGTADKTVGITGNFTTVELELGEGDLKRKWGFVFKTGIQDDTVQGLKTNLQPDDKQMRFYVMSAASMVTTVGGVPFRVIDENLDGLYGSPPRGWLNVGLSEGIEQPEFDSVVIGESKRARPWSEYQDIGGAWFKLAADKAGNEIRSMPVQLETGTIKLEFKGPTPSWLILRGTGQMENYFVDVIAEAKKPVTVPVGVYQLFLGELRAGKKAQTQKCLIVPGADTKRWTVKKGEECVVQLGGPFSFDFKQTVNEDKLTIKGKSITIMGVALERYERTWNCVPRPEVSWRKSGSKKGSKPEKMDVVGDLLEQDEAGNYRFSEADTWRPIDTVFEVKPGESIEVQLSEAKNKLFGSIESAWR
jgi:hypothetical protein